MKIHHLDCGSASPLLGRLWDGTTPLNRPAHLLFHCLAIDLGEELVLVDTGLGSNAVAAPRTWMGGAWTQIFNPTRDPARTALAQIAELGFRPDQVRIVTTHLDADHSGGLADFPDSPVYVHAAELAALRTAPTLGERKRYRANHFHHQPQWRPLIETGDTWMGMPAIRDIAGLPPEIVVVPLPGHSRGHIGVAVQREDGGWLLHAGDAYFVRSEIAAEPHCPPLMNLFRRATATHSAERAATVDRLRALALDTTDEVSIVNSHDPTDFPAAAGLIASPGYSLADMSL